MLFRSYAASAQDVDTVLVDGRVLLQNKELTTIDLEKVIFEVNRCIEYVLPKN